MLQRLMVVGRAGGVLERWWRGFSQAPDAARLLAFAGFEVALASHVEAFEREPDDIAGRWWRDREDLEAIRCVVVEDEFMTRVAGWFSALGVARPPAVCVPGGTRALTLWSLSGEVACRSVAVSEVDEHVWAAVCSVRSDAAHTANGVIAIVDDDPERFGSGGDWGAPFPTCWAVLPFVVRNWSLAVPAERVELSRAIARALRELARERKPMVVFIDNYLTDPGRGKGGRCHEGARVAPLVQCLLPRALVIPVSAIRGPEGPLPPVSEVTSPSFLTNARDAAKALATDWPCGEAWTRNRSSAVSVSTHGSASLISLAARAALADLDELGMLAEINVLEAPDDDVLRRASAIVVDPRTRAQFAQALRAWRERSQLHVDRSLVESEVREAGIEGSFRTALIDALEWTPIDALLVELYRLDPEVATDEGSRIDEQRVADWIRDKRAGASDSTRWTPKLIEDRGTLIWKWEIRHGALGQYESKLLRLWSSSDKHGRDHRRKLISTLTHWRNAVPAPIGATSGDRGEE